MPEDSSEDVPEDSVCMCANTMPTMPTIQAQTVQPPRSAASSAQKHAAAAAWQGWRFFGAFKRNNRSECARGQPCPAVRAVRDRDGGSSSPQEVRVRAGTAPSRARGMCGLCGDSPEQGPGDVQTLRGQPRAGPGGCADTAGPEVLRLRTAPRAML
jgi:hypothetical protein